MTRRTRAAAAVALLVVFAAGLIGVCARHDGGVDNPSLLGIDDGGLRFTYHVLSGDEGLFDLAADPKMLRNLVRERPDDARRLRDELTRRVKKEQPGVDSLDDLRRRPEVMERLRGHPYF